MMRHRFERNCKLVGVVTLVAGLWYPVVDVMQFVSPWTDVAKFQMWHYRWNSTMLTSCLVCITILIVQQQQPTTTTNPIPTTSSLQLDKLGQRKCSEFACCFWLAAWRFMLSRVMMWFLTTKAMTCCSSFTTCKRQRETGMFPRDTSKQTVNVRR